MKDNEMEAYLQQLKSMGMTDEMIALYAQQMEQSMQMAAQFGGDDMSGMAENMLGAMGFDGDDDGITMADTTDLTPEQQWGIACGADLALLNDHPLNTLETGDERRDARTLLSEWWGVDGRDELLETIASLQEDGAHTEFQHVDAALRMGSTTEAKKYLQENCDDFDQAMEWFHNMREAYEQFAEDGLLPAGAPMPNLISWDYARVVNLCRNGFDAKYLDREEALDTIMKMAKAIQQSYASWRDLSISYQLGRYVWGGGEDGQYEALQEGMEELLSAENSPWVNLDWNMKL